MRWKTIVFYTLLLVAYKVMPAQEISVDRPDQTDGVHLVPTGSLQIESGLAAVRSSKVYNYETQLMAPALLLRYGISEKFEARLFYQSERLIRNPDNTVDSSADNITAGTKIRILHNEDSKTGIAFLAGWTFPVMFDKQSNNYSIFESKISVSHKMNDKTDLGYNIGFVVLGENPLAFIFTLIMGYSTGPRSNIFIETFGEISKAEGRKFSFDAGYSYLIRKNFQIDFAAGTGINHKMFFLTTGCGWNFSTSKSPEKNARVSL